MGDIYYSDYENEPIGGGNPYYRCIYCKRSDPEINGRLEGHNKECPYRITKEFELKVNKGKPLKNFDHETLNNLTVDVIDIIESELSSYNLCLSDEDSNELCTQLEKILDKYSVGYSHQMG